jgi:uncharacterized protein
MEEILSSIRRILAEDESRAGPVPRRARATADVLDLTEMVGEDGTVRHIEPASMRRDAQVAPPLPDGRVEPVPPRPPDAANDSRLLSKPASEAVAASFSRLLAVPQAEGRGDEPTLDNVLRETLRPMLQAWLDEHLPALVEQLVQAEIARVVGETGQR